MAPQQQTRSASSRTAPPTETRSPGSDRRGPLDLQPVLARVAAGALSVPDAAALLGTAEDLLRLAAADEEAPPSAQGWRAQLVRVSRELERWAPGRLLVLLRPQWLAELAPEEWQPQPGPWTVQAGLVQPAQADDEERGALARALAADGAPGVQATSSQTGAGSWLAVPLWPAGSPAPRGALLVRSDPTAPPAAQASLEAVRWLADALTEGLEQLRRRQAQAVRHRLLGQDRLARWISHALGNLNMVLCCADDLSQSTMAELVGLLPDLGRRLEQLGWRGSSDDPGAGLASGSWPTDDAAEEATAAEEDPGLGLLAEDVAELGEDLRELRERSLALADRIRLAGKPVQEPPVEVDLAAMVARILRTGGPGSGSAGRLPQLRLEASGPVTVISHATMLERLLRELLNNALEHGSSAQPPVVRLARGEDWVELLVQNQGPGVTAERQTDLFMPLNSGLGERGVQRGLGLAIARRAAHHLGASLTVGWTPGGETCATLRLPSPTLRGCPLLVLGAGPLPEEVEALLAVADLRRLTADGVEPAELATGARPRLALLDGRLGPEATGTLLARLRREHGELPVVRYGGGRPWAEAGSDGLASQIVADLPGADAGGLAQELLLLLAEATSPGRRL